MQTLASVRVQKFTDWELIVVDDGSTDGTAAALDGLDEPRLRVVRQAHTGNAARARNAGLRLATGRYVAFLDSDDVWFADKLAVQIPELERSGCRWGYTSIRRMDGEGRELPSRVEQRSLPGGHILEPLLRLEAVVVLPTVVAERSLIEEAGGFDESFTHCQDYELWMRLAEIAPVHVTAAALTCIRVHERHLQSDRVAVHEAWVRLFARRAAAARDPRIAALCRAQRDEHRLLLVHAANARGDTARALRALADAAAACWRRPAFWWAMGRAVLAPFPRGRRVVRRLLGRAS